MPSPSLASVIVDTFVLKHSEKLKELFTQKTFLDLFESILLDVVRTLASNVEYQSQHTQTHKGVVILLRAIHKKLVSKKLEFDIIRDEQSQFTNAQFRDFADKVLASVPSARSELVTLRDFHEHLNSKLTQFAIEINDEYPSDKFQFKLSMHTKHSNPDLEQVVPNVTFSDVQLKMYLNGGDLDEIIDNAFCNLPYNYQWPDCVESINLESKPHTQKPLQLLLDLKPESDNEHKSQHTKSLLKALPVTRHSSTKPPATATLQTCTQPSHNNIIPHCNDMNRTMGPFFSPLVNGSKTPIYFKKIKASEISALPLDRYVPEPWLSIRHSLDFPGFRIFMYHNAFRRTQFPELITQTALLLSDEFFSSTRSDFVQRCEVLLQIISVKSLSKGFHFPDPLEEKPTEIISSHSIFSLTSKDLDALIQPKHFNQLLLQQIQVLGIFLRHQKYVHLYNNDAQLRQIFAVANAVQQMAEFNAPPASSSLSSCSQPQSATTILNFLEKLKVQWHPASDRDNIKILTTAMIPNLPFGLSHAKFVCDFSCMPDVVQVPAGIHPSLSGKLLVVASPEILSLLQNWFPQGAIRHSHHVIGSLVFRRGVWCLPGPSCPVGFVDSIDVFFKAHEDSFLESYQQGEDFIQFSTHCLSDD